MPMVEAWWFVPPCIPPSNHHVFTIYI